MTPAGTSNELDVQNEWEENNIPLSPCVPENLVSRDGFGSPVPRQSAHLHDQAESSACLRDSSRVPRRRPFIYFKSAYATGSVPSYRVTQLRTDGVHGHRASKPQSSSERVLPSQVTMDQLICASLSHTHYWYEVGILKVPTHIEGRLNEGPQLQPKHKDENETKQNKGNTRERRHGIFKPNARRIQVHATRG